jgi:8-oxo-dGTP pyrophosphatase MutT (NUDIX family)
LSAAHRELSEETGIEVQDLWLCGLITVDTGDNIGVGIYILRGDLPTISGDYSDQLPPTTEGILEWVQIDQLHILPLVEDLPVLLPRILQAQLGDPPFSAHYWYDEEDRLMILFRD